MLNALASEILSNHASEELKKTWLPQIASGEKVVGVAITEPAAGTDAGGIRSTAVRKGDYYILNGEKSGISAVTMGDMFIIFAKTDVDGGSRGISAFVVPADLPGVGVKAMKIWAMC